MNSDTEHSIKCQSLNELVTSLIEEDIENFGDIFRSIKIPASTFENYCSWSGTAYTRNCIVENEKFELILLCWEKGQITPIHDHGGEECWVKVIQGKLQERIYKKESSGALKMIKSSVSVANQITYMRDFIGFHSLENLSDHRSMSLHLYANPIRSCKVFNKNLNEFTQKELSYHTTAK